MPKISPDPPLHQVNGRNFKFGWTIPLKCIALSFRTWLSKHALKRDPSAASVLPWSNNVFLKRLLPLHKWGLSPLNTSFRCQAWAFSVVQKSEGTVQHWLASSEAVLPNEWQPARDQSFPGKGASGAAGSLAGGVRNGLLFYGDRCEKLQVSHAELFESVCIQCRHLTNAVAALFLLSEKKRWLSPCVVFPPDVLTVQICLKENGECSSLCVCHRHAHTCSGGIIAGIYKEKFNLLKIVRKSMHKIKSNLKFI